MTATSWGWDARLAVMVMSKPQTVRPAATR